MILCTQLIPDHAFLFLLVDGNVEALICIPATTGLVGLLGSTAGMSALATGGGSSATDGDILLKKRDVRSARRTWSGFESLVNAMCPARLLQRSEEGSSARYIL